MNRLTDDCLKVAALLTYLAAYFPGGVTTLRFGGQMGKPALHQSCRHDLLINLPLARPMDQRYVGQEACCRFEPRYRGASSRLALDPGHQYQLSLPALRCLLMCSCAQPHNADGQKDEVRKDTMYTGIPSLGAETPASFARQPDEDWIPHAAPAFQRETLHRKRRSCFDRVCCQTSVEAWRRDQP